MGLIQLVVILILIGVGLYLINKYVPMDGKIKTIINIVIVVVVIIWLLRVVGVFNGSMHDIKI